MLFIDGPYEFFMSDIDDDMSDQLRCCEWVEDGEKTYRICRYAPAAFDASRVPIPYTQFCVLKSFYPKFIAMSRSSADRLLNRALSDAKKVIENADN